MEEKVLFELPIYCISKDKYEAITAAHAAHMRSVLERSGMPETRIYSIVPPELPWKYNQIVGYITISVSHEDVAFQLYLCLRKKRIQYSSSQKNYIEDCRCTGLHFRAIGMSNDEIRPMIQKYLHSIEAERIPKQFVVDYSTFDNVFAYTDIAGIMSNEFCQEAVEFQPQM